MKSVFLRLFNIICLIIIIIVSQSNLGGVINPSKVSAGPGIMRWETVSTPNSEPRKNDVLNPLIAGSFTGSEIRDIAVGGDGVTLLTAVTVDGTYVGAPAGPQGVLFTSRDGGISWNIFAHSHLISSGFPATNHVYNVAIATDDPSFWAVTTGTAGAGPTSLWVSSDRGASWKDTMVLPLGAGAAICSVDISVDYGNGHDIMIGTRSGTGTGGLYVRKGSDFGSWVQQSNPLAGVPIDYFAVKFSPAYAGDSSIVEIACNDNATFYNIGLRDISSNNILSWAYPGMGVEVKANSLADNISPSYASLVKADLSLPSDFSGASASLRRAFVSLYGISNAIEVIADGIYRIDDAVPTVLMNTANSTTSKIYSIAFFGTYSSGKLMAGFARGTPRNATVPTLFADTPCTCAGSCLYPSLKPPTGAGNQAFCSDTLLGVGSAVVDWSPNGALAYAVTGSGILSDNITWWDSPNVPGNWITTLIPNDETAFSISRNNGETWNQLSLIDTTIDWFNDVAVSPDCTTVYLASVHRNTGIGCNEFDSVWRSTTNMAVAAPMPVASKIGSYWERVFLHTTSVSCNFTQSDLPILRTINSCTDYSDGGVVAWAARGASATATGGGVMAWSPDYGDYWSMITPRNIVQDFCFESSTVIYNLSPLGMVQKLVYTGTSWSTALPGADTGLGDAHTVAVQKGKVLVGASFLTNSNQGLVSFSADSGQHWYIYRDALPARANVHVIFDVDYQNNGFIYAATVNEDMLTGSVYRNTAPAFVRWHDNDMMDGSNGAIGSDWWNDGYSQSAGDPPHRRGQYGIVMAFTGNPQPALYSAHDNITTSVATVPGGESPSDSGVCRTLEPRNGMPKPGIYWDCLDIFAPLNMTDVHFTLEPSSLKACGCCTLDSATTLWAIDDESGNTLINPVALTGRYLQYPGYRPDINQGMLWAYTDCLAKKGPVLISPADNGLVGADPVSGRNQQIDLSWEQLCLTTVHLLQIAKDPEFTMRINPAVNNGAAINSVTGNIILMMDANNMTSPAAWISPAALPEAGAKYYWRVRSYKSATGQIAVSPYSEVRSFSVKPGFIVNTPYLGVQLLAPDNGCKGCKTRPASFSWSPWKEATLYEFVLARDSEFKNIVRTDQTVSTGYEYEGSLDYSTNYFWRVRAIDVNNNPISSDWSATFSFQTEPAPAVQSITENEPAIPAWVWVVIGLGSSLVVLSLILIIRTRRRL